MTHNQRKRVYILSIREVEEIFDLKTAVEGSVARWATERGKEEDFTELRILQEEINRFLSDRAADPQDEEAWLEKWLNLDRTLHAHLFKMAENHRSEGVSLRRKR